MADVPVGAFLSGGIDSSTVVALYQKYSIATGAHLLDRLRGSGVQRGRARQGGRRASRHGAQRALCDGAARRATSFRCCPPCTTSRSPIPRRSRPISSAASPAQQVKVALTGDGGDELFGGYNRHFMAPRLWQRLQQAAAAAASLAAGGSLGRCRRRFWSRRAGMLAGRGSRRTSAARSRRRCGIAGSAAELRRRLR